MILQYVDKDHKKKIFIQQYKNNLKLYNYRQLFIKYSDLYSN